MRDFTIFDWRSWEPHLHQQTSSYSANPAFGKHQARDSLSLDLISGPDPPLYTGLEPGLPIGRHVRYHVHQISFRLIRITKLRLVRYCPRWHQAVFEKDTVYGRDAPVISANESEPGPLWRKVECHFMSDFHICQIHMLHFRRIGPIRRIIKLLVERNQLKVRNISKLPMDGLLLSSGKRNHRRISCYCKHIQYAKSESKSVRFSETNRECETST